MNIERYRELVLARIAKGHFIIRKKAVPKRKSPTGKGIPAVKEQVPGVVTKQLIGKTMQNMTGEGMERLEEEIGNMRKQGIIHVTNGLWWKREKK